MAATRKLIDILPPVIKKILTISNGWLVGSSINTLLTSDDIPNDYDIIVSDRQLYQNIVLLLADDYEITINNCGGIKATQFITDNSEKSITLKIDVWPEELSHFLENTNSFTYAFNMRKRILIKNSI